MGVKKGSDVEKMKDDQPQMKVYEREEVNGVVTTAHGGNGYGGGAGDGWRCIVTHIYM
jgi:hypothetical protein